MRHPRIAVLAAVLTACVLPPASPWPRPSRSRPWSGWRTFTGRVLRGRVHGEPQPQQLFPNVFYKSVSAYWQVAAGPFTYEVWAAARDPESQPVIQVKGNLAAGKAYTVAAVGRRDQLQGLLLRDDMAPSAPGKAKVRFLDAAFDLPAVDIAVAGGPVLKSRLA